MGEQQFPVFQQPPVCTSPKPCPPSPQRAFLLLQSRLSTRRHRKAGESSGPSTPTQTPSSSSTQQHHKRNRSRGILGFFTDHCCCSPRRHLPLSTASSSPSPVRRSKYPSRQNGPRPTSHLLPLPPEPASGHHPMVRPHLPSGTTSQRPLLLIRPQEGVARARP
jgi:hypothetical protein